MQQRENAMIDAWATGGWVIVSVTEKRGVDGSGLHPIHSMTYGM